MIREEGCLCKTADVRDWLQSSGPFLESWPVRQSLFCSSMEWEQDRMKLSYEAFALVQVSTYETWAKTAPEVEV